MFTFDLVVCHNAVQVVYVGDLCEPMLVLVAVCPAPAIHTYAVQKAGQAKTKFPQ